MCYWLRMLTYRSYGTIAVRHVFFLSTHIPFLRND